MYINILLFLSIFSTWIQGHREELEPIAAAIGKEVEWTSPHSYKCPGSSFSCRNRSVKNLWIYILSFRLVVSYQLPCNTLKHIHRVEKLWYKNVFSFYFISFQLYSVWETLNMWSNPTQKLCQVTEAGGVDKILLTPFSKMHFSSVQVYL